MARLIELKSIRDQRGDLTVFDRELPFDVKRTFFLYNITPGESRGGHGHYRTQIALVCVKGKCNVRTNSGKEKNNYSLSKIDQVLILNPEDWHIISDFSSDAIVLALASHSYDKEDYFYEEPK